MADDCEFVRNVLKNQIKTFTTDCRINETSDGEMALEYYKTNYSRIDIAIIDNQMPKMDGIELIKKIREFEHENSLARLSILCIFSRLSNF